MGTRRRHLRTPRRGATVPPHLRQQPQRATDAKNTWGESGRPSSEALPAENPANGLRLGHAARASSDGLTAAHRRRRICANRHRGRRTQRTRGARAAGRAARRCPRGIGSELGTRRGHLRTPWRGATARAASFQAVRPERGPRSTQCGVAHGEITSSHATTLCDAVARDAKQTWGRSARRATISCKRRIVEAVCALSTHHGHARTLRSGATTPPHLCKPSSWATDAKKTWGEIGRPGSDALPAENRENNLRIGHAARAAWDAVARRNSAGRIFANRRSGER